MDKQSIRLRMKSLRSDLPQSEVLKKSRQVSQNILALAQVTKANHILVYLPINNEVDPKSIIGKLLAENKMLYLPYFDNSLKKYAVTAYKKASKLIPGPFGINQPENARPASLAKMGIAVLPGLAFDRQGYRLGYGKGIYDMLLQKSKAIKIGLAYDFQLLEQIPHEPHDLKMDFVVTEKKVLQTT